MKAEVTEVSIYTFIYKAGNKEDANENKMIENSVCDLGPHVEETQIRVEKIRLNVVCAVHTVMGEKNTYEQKKNWSLLPAV